MIWPIESSELAEIVPTWAISLDVVVGFEAFFSSIDQGRDGLVDAALQVHRVHAGGHVLHAFAHDGLRQHGGGGGAVTGVVAGLGSDFLDHLRAHVLELVLQLDFLGHGHAVLGDRGGAERALEHDVATLGAQRDLDRVGQDVHAFDHACAGVRAKNDVFCCHEMFLRNSVNEGFRAAAEPGCGSAAGALCHLAGEGRPAWCAKRGPRAKLLTSRRRRRGLLRASRAARRRRP